MCRRHKCAACSYAAEAPGQEQLYITTARLRVTAKDSVHILHYDTSPSLLVQLQGRKQVGCPVDCFSFVDPRLAVAEFRTLQYSRLAAGAAAGPQAGGLLCCFALCATLTVALVHHQHGMVGCLLHPPRSGSATCDLPPSLKSC